MDFGGNETRDGAIETAPLPIATTAEEVELVRGQNNERVTGKSL